MATVEAITAELAGYREALAATETALVEVEAALPDLERRREELAQVYQAAIDTWAAIGPRHRAAHLYSSHTDARGITRDRPALRCTCEQEEAEAAATKESLGTELQQAQVALNQRLRQRGQLRANRDYLVMRIGQADAALATAQQRAQAEEGRVGALKRRLRRETPPAA